MTQQPVTETGLVKWEVAGRIVQMDRHQARAICPTATDDQIECFLQYAAHMGLDPWAKEIMLIPFGGNTGPPTIYVWKEAYIRRAEAHPDLDYFIPVRGLVRTNLRKMIRQGKSPLNQCRCR